MHTAYIGLGSNLGSRREHLLGAWQHLGRVPGVTLDTLSNPYESAPVGIDSHRMFMNAVGRVLTELTPDQLLAALLAIESDFGRDRSKGHDRSVDLDLLIFDRLIVQSPELTIPHVGIPGRLFVLLPLAEIAPAFIHPVNGASLQELIANLAFSGQQIHRMEWPSCKMVEV